MRKMPHYKSLDRGPVDFKSRVHRKEGDIMTIAKRQVVSVPQTMRIKNAVDLMVKEGIRRLPVTEPGTKRLIGVVRTRDILEFLGGGEKFNIVRVKFSGNFLAAVNEPVKLIMERDLTYGTSRMSITEVARLILERGVGGVPILDDDKKIAGIVAERDFLQFVPEVTGAKVSYYMSRHIVAAESSFSVLDVVRTIVSRGFRRLPVVSGGRLVGIVTTMDLLRYLSSNRIFDYMSSEKFEDAMSISVEEIMTPEVVKIAPEVDVGEAAGIMHQRGCGGLPVVSGDELVGIITEHDLMRLLV